MGVSQPVEVSDTQPIRRSERVPRAHERYGFMAELEDSDIDPKMYEESLEDKDSGNSYKQ